GRRILVRIVTHQIAASLIDVANVDLVQVRVDGAQQAKHSDRFSSNQWTGLVRVLVQNREENVHQFRIPLVGFDHKATVFDQTAHRPESDLAFRNEGCVLDCCQQSWKELVEPGTQLQATDNRLFTDGVQYRGGNGLVLVVESRHKCL